MQETAWKSAGKLRWEIVREPTREAVNRVGIYEGLMEGEIKSGIRSGKILGGVIRQPECVLVSLTGIQRCQRFLFVRSQFELG